MPSTQIPIIKGENIGVETDYRDALPVNMYAVFKEILGAKGYMLCYPGLTEFVTGFGIDRGGVYNERLEDHFRVSGTKFISVHSQGSGTAVDIDTIPGTDQVSMPYSFNTQAVIANGNMYLYDGNAFSQVTDPDLGSPIDAIWINGYYFLTDGEYIYHTDIDDETSIDPLKFATAEFMPDPSLGLLKTQDNKVMVFGRYSLEYFIDRATENFAFQRVETRAQKIGIVATHAKCEIGSVYITGGKKDEGVGVYRIGIGSSEKISSREIDKIIGQYTEPELSDMRMEGRTENDVTFVIVHLPNETLCYNVEIAAAFGNDYAWSLLKTGTEDVNYRAINGVLDARSSKWIFGDKQDDTIGELDDTACTQYGEIAEWYLYTPLFRLDGMSIDEIELEIIPGHTTTQDAQVALCATFDGNIYGKETWIKYGDIQDYNSRLIMRHLGEVTDWVGLRFRGVSQSRMSFAFLRLDYA